MKESTIAVQACGDYVAFGEMGVGVVYEFGTCDVIDILDEIVDNRLELIYDKIHNDERLTNEEQKLLDEIVEEYIKNYTEDCCSLCISSGYYIEGNWYINF